MFEHITGRLREVWRLIAHAWTNKRIAAHLYIEVGTVRYYCNKLYTILKLSTNPDISPRPAAAVLYWEFHNTKGEEIERRVF